MILGGEGVLLLSPPRWSGDRDLPRLGLLDLLADRRRPLETDRDRPRLGLLDLLTDRRRLREKERERPRLGLRDLLVDLRWPLETDLDREFDRERRFLESGDLPRSFLVFLFCR